MTRIAIAAVASLVFVATYSLSPLVAVAIAAMAAAVLTAFIAIGIREAEQREIAHVMNIIDACDVTEPFAAEPIRLVS